MKNTLVCILYSLLALPVCHAADAPKDNPKPTVERITIDGRSFSINW